MSKCKNRLSFLLVVIATGVFFFSSCKKEIGGSDQAEDCEYNNDVAELELKDSVHYYTKLLSLWQDELLPRNINDIDKEGVLRKLTAPYCRAEDVLEWLKGQTHKTVTGRPVDRFSFLDREGVISDELEEGVTTDFGMYVFYLQTSENESAHLYVRMVERNSPAYHGGLKRGAKIISLNGNSNIDYDSQEQEDFRTVDNALSSSKLIIEFQNQGEEIRQAEILASQYDMDPVLKDTIFNTDQKKVGYLAYNSFISVGNREAPGAKGTQLKSIFDRYAQQGVDDLIVDLRYNGGGSVVTAEFIADYIAPSTADKKLMYKYSINRVLENEGWNEEGDIFEDVFFKKKGSLNLPRVYFLVSKASASASELLINVLEPYMDVYLVGSYGSDGYGGMEKQNTYGKPVGFFPFPVNAPGQPPNDLYVVSFQMTNAIGKSDYFNGLVPDFHAYEGYLNDFGDSDEGLIEAALSHIQSGSFPVAKAMLRAQRGAPGMSSGVIQKDLNLDKRNNDMYKFNNSGNRSPKNFKLR